MVNPAAMTHPLLAGRFLVTLEDQREIELKTFSQRLTYLGLICGTPNRAMNRDLMESHLRLAKDKQDRLSVPLKPIMLEPAVALVPSNQFGLTADIQNPHEALPPVLSIAVFDSNAVSSQEACSSTLVVWYQDQWGLPTSAALEYLRKLEWAKHARDWSW